MAKKRTFEKRNGFLFDNKQPNIKCKYCGDKLSQLFCFTVCQPFSGHLKQHPTKQQLYDHLPPITKTFKIRRTRNAGHCWKSRDELISDVLPWTPSHDRAKAGRSARIYIQPLCEDMGCNTKDLPEAMNDWER